MTKTIEKERIINATPQRVFQALSEKAEMERWFVQKAEGDVRPGGAIRFEWAPEVVEVGTILAFEPSHRLSYSWEALEPSPTTITIELTTENDGTRLHLTHTGIGEGENWEGYYTALNSGWNKHLANLTAWLETGMTCDIVHTIDIKTTPERLYEAITTQKGIAGWWTPQVKAEPTH